MDYYIRKHNIPISTAIKGYIEKDGGKVSVSRIEIKRRFDGLDWRHQKKILFAFLQSGKTDREWAYNKLYAVWDNCFIPVLKELWEQYHEKQVSWLIIRFFPVDYLKKEFENLSKDRNYYFLYQRLVGDEDFILDKTRLYECDLLHIMYTSGETITDDDIRDYFFLLIYKLCRGVYHFRGGKLIDVNDSLLSLFNYSIVRSMRMEIGMLERFELNKELHEWMLYVTSEFKRSYELVYNNRFYFFGKGWQDFFHDKMKEHCLKYIDPKYTTAWDQLDIENQQLFLEYLEERHREHLMKKDLVRRKNNECMKILLGNNPSRKLIENFGLEIVENDCF